MNLSAHFSFKWEHLAHESKNMDTAIHVYQNGCRLVYPIIIDIIMSTVLPHAAAFAVLGLNFGSVTLLGCVSTSEVCMKLCSFAFSFSHKSFSLQIRVPSRFAQYSFLISLITTNTTA